MANQGTLELCLSDVQRRTLKGFEARIELRRSGADLPDVTYDSFPVKAKILLPAFPQAESIQLRVVTARFRIRSADVFTLTHGETIQRTLTLFRRPSRWTARFTKFTRLGSDHQALRDVVTRSAELKVRDGRALDDYDDADSTRTILAKAALLNLYAKLSTMIEPVGGKRSWFSFVDEVLEIGRERLIARVDPQIGRVVRKIKDRIADFDDYKHTPAKNHAGNVAPYLSEFRKGDMFSIKSKEAKGNIQLTLAPGRDAAGKQVMLLDADIDENGKLLAHIADVFKHKFTGGTHPFAIHEYLALEEPSRDLGYKLV